MMFSLPSVSPACVPCVWPRLVPQVMDVGQFVVQSGQLSGTAVPCVLSVFVEYFTPFTGLLPLVRTQRLLERVDASLLATHPSPFATLQRNVLLRATAKGVGWAAGTLL